jgi:hypothetical protein
MDPIGEVGTPANVRLAYPNAFSTYTIDNGDVTDNLQALTNSVASGDILFFDGWYNSTSNAQVEQIYQAAAGNN